jgi:hypothetical protein
VKTDGDDAAAKGCAEISLAGAAPSLLVSQNYQGAPPLVADAPRPDAQVSKSEKQGQDATQRGAAEKHRPIERCQPKQPAFAHYTTDHRYARCETDRSIVPAGDNGCSAEATSGRKRRLRLSNTKGLSESVGTLSCGVAFLPHVSD